MSMLPVPLPHPHPLLPSALQSPVPGAGLPSLSLAEGPPSSATVTASSTTVTSTDPSGAGDAQLHEQHHTKQPTACPSPHVEGLA